MIRGGELRTRSIIRIALLTSAMALASPVLADPPTTKRLIGTLVTPADAWIYYGASTTHTNGVAHTPTRSPEVRALARALSRDGALTGDAFAQRVSDYVRRNIEMEFRFGLGKGARGAAIDQSGTAFDQAELMVEVLREKGQAASYQVGTITLNAEQFGKWTGLVTGLVQASQSFTVNAKAACQLLADGGIPATVNGASSCTGLTGNLNTVTLGHIWVSTNGKLYDPAYKTHILKTGIDIPAAMGCGTAAAPTCGAGIEAAALVGASQGTSPAPWIQNVNQQGVENYIQARAVSLQNAIEAIDPTAPLIDILGGAEIDIRQAAPGASALPYPGAAQLTLASTIPDQFRTKFRVQFMGLDTSLWADELVAKRLRLSTNAGPESFVRGSALILDGYQIAGATSLGTYLQIDRPKLSVDHPFAGGTQAGSYGDSTADIAIGQDSRNSNGCVVSGSVTLCTLGYQKDAYVVFALGKHGEGIDQAYTKLMFDFKESGGIGPNPNPYAAFSYDANRIPLEAPSLSAKYFNQVGRSSRIISSLGNGRAETINYMGLLFSQINPGDGQLYFNMSMTTKSVSASGSASDEQGMFAATAAAAAALEGGVQQQSADAFESSASVSMFKLANTKSYRFYQANSSNISNVLGSTSNFSAERKSILQNYAALGYNVIVPSNGSIGTVNLPGSGTGSVSLSIAPELISSDTEIGYLINEEYKGGSALAKSDPPKDVLASAAAASNNVKDKKYFGVDFSTGGFNLMPPSDIVEGSGAGSLEFRRSYSSGKLTGAIWNSYIYTIPGSYGFNVRTDTDITGASGRTEIGGGWNHNLNVNANWSGSGLEGLGATTALRGSRGIASLFGLIDVSRSLTFQRRMTAAFVGYSFIDSFVRNIVNATTADTSVQFVRLADGRFDPPPSARGFRMSQVGNVSAPYIQSSSIPVNSGIILRSYVGTEFVVADSDGTLTNYKPSEGTYLFGPDGPIYAATRIDAPTFLRRDFSYTTVSSQDFGYQRRRLMGISSSTGNKIDLKYPVYLDANGQPSGYEGSYGDLQSVFSTGRSVNFSSCSEPVAVPAVFYGAGKTYYLGSCAKNIADPVGGTTKYGYAFGDGSYANSPYPDRLLKAWYTPLNPTTPYLTINYDPTLKVSSYTDIGGKATKAFVSTIADDKFRIGEMQDPSGAITSTIFDENGSALQVTDPVGRVTSNVYDSARRLLRTVYPEGNASEYTYDLRGNRTRECMIPKGAVNWSTLTAINERTPQCNTSRTPVADLATTTSYVEAANLRADQCVNMKTCNKVSYTIDAKGHRTDYTWSGVHGQLLTETMPSDTSGNRPVTTYGYSTFTGVDGATFYLLTSKAETISPGVTTTTSYEYDTANKFVLKSSVVDNGGLSLRTCYKFDPAGNLINKTDPKAGLTACP